MYSFLEEQSPEIFRTYSLSSGRTLRSLKFEETKHKLLSSELKHLYTALTRARSNVWIYDKNETKRSPMFDYFTAFEVVRIESEKEAEEGEGAFRFAKDSTPDDWAKQGDYFYSHERWKLAGKCYGKAGDTTKESKSLMRHLVIEAASTIDKKAKVEKVVHAALHALKCGMFKQAGQLLLKGGEPMLAAGVLEKSHLVI